MAFDLSAIPIVGRMRATIGIVARGLEHRAELAGVELVEARQEAAIVSAYLAVGALIALHAGLAANLLIAAIWWDSPHRVLAMVVALTAQASLAAICIGIGVFRARRWHPFATTIEQLKKDSQCVRDLTQPKSP
jgi:uncharacterized membrane protein YqjE